LTSQNIKIKRIYYIFKKIRVMKKTVNKMKSMKNKFLFIPIIIVFFAFTPSEFNHFFINAAKIAKKSVVSILVYKKVNSNGYLKYKKIANASGTIITKDGFVVTNYHVVSKGNIFKIITADGKIYTVSLLKKGKFFLSDIKTDIALLKINSQQKFIPIRFSNSNRLEAGEWVLAIGNPYGLRQSITSGIVSFKGRDNVGFTDIEDFIQSDVSINPGNSGGPLINLKGAMVGLNTAIRTVTGGYQGISFAIPSNIIKQVYYELRRFGRVRRGWLGFIIKENKLDGGCVNVISVLKNSPAAKSGIKKGDLIVSVDGIGVHTVSKMIKLVGKKSVGSFLEVKIKRNGRFLKKRFILREKNEYKKIAHTIREIYRFYGFEIDENSSTGSPVVADIAPNSIIYGLKKGDIITFLNGQKISNLENLIKIFYKSGKKISKIEILRDSEYYEFILDN